MFIVLWTKWVYVEKLSSGDAHLIDILSIKAKYDEGFYDECERWRTKSKSN